MSMLFKRIKDWATSITAFRTGDMIPVDGPSGTAKMGKDDLLRETAENTLGSIHSLSDTATESDLVSSKYLALDGSTGTKKLPGDCIAPKSVQDNLQKQLCYYNSSSQNLNPGIGTINIGFALPYYNAGATVFLRAVSSDVFVSSLSLNVYSGSPEFAGYGTLPVDGEWHKFTAKNITSHLFILQKQNQSFPNSATIQCEILQVGELINIIENDVSTVAAKADDLDFDVNGVTDSVIKTVSVNTDINYRINLREGEDTFTFAFSSPSAELSGKSIKIYFSNFAYGGAAEVGGEPITLHKPAGVLNYVYVQNTDKDWTTATTLQVDVNYIGLSGIVESLQNQVDDVSEDLENLDENVFGATKTTNVNVVVGSNINDRISLKSGKDEFYLKVSSPSAELNGKSIKTFFNVSGSYVGGQEAVVNGNKVLIKKPFGASDGFLVQNTEKDWTSNTTLVVVVIYIGAIEELQVDAPYMELFDGVGLFGEYNIVSVGNGKDFPTIQQAINSITDASYSNQYIVMVYDDFVISSLTDLWVSGSSSHPSSVADTCYFAILKNYVHVVGVGKRKISMNLGDGGSDQYANCNCLFMKGNCTLANFEVTCSYSRYCLHIESGTASTDTDDANSIKRVVNCDFKYLTSNSYNTAIGIGTAPGEKIYFENCSMWSVSKGINNVHDLPNYAYPFLLCLKNCKINCNVDLFYNCITSGKSATIEIEGCTIDWFGQLIDVDYSNSLAVDSDAADISKQVMCLAGHGNKCSILPFTFKTCCLESSSDDVDVDIINTGNSNDAYVLIFGKPYKKYSAALDARGLYVGTQLVASSTSSSISLAGRLGDCSVNNKKLTVSVGGVNQEITLDHDYSGMSNSSIITAINALITGATIKLGNFNKIFVFNDCSVERLNGSSATINIGDILAENSDGTVKKAGSADKVFGIAAERINPGAVGEIVIKGGQGFQNAGGLLSVSFGAFYKNGSNGTLVAADGESDAVFIGSRNNVLNWL